MPGRSLDTTGLCVTSARYEEVPHQHWSGTSPLTGAGGAIYSGGAALSSVGSYGVNATGTSGGLIYTMSSMPSAYANLKIYFSALYGPVTVKVYSGTNTSSTGTQLGSGTASYISPAFQLNGLGPIWGSGGVGTIGGTITIVVTSSGPGPSLFSIDSIGYGWITFTLNTTLYTQCGEPKDKYEFGFNGQIKTNEIAGIGNHNTALF